MNALSFKSCASTIPLYPAPQPFKKIVTNIMFNEYLILNDKWQTYTVRFSIYYPLSSNKEMRLNGERKIYGRWA